jgi:hypothetical protein
MLCGFGYFLDLAWSQGVALMASAILWVNQESEHMLSIFNAQDDYLVKK